MPSPASSASPSGATRLAANSKPLASDTAGSRARTLISKQLTATIANTASDQSQPPLPSSLVLYQWPVTYTTNSEGLVTRVIVSRGDEPVVKDTSKKKPTPAAQPPTITELVKDDSVDVSLTVGEDSGLLCNVYSVDDWKAHNNTATFYNYGDDTDTVLPPLHQSLSLSSVSLSSIQLTKDRPLVIEVYVDPSRKGSAIEQWEQQRYQARITNAVTATSHLPLPSPSTTKKKSAKDKGIDEEPHDDDKLPLSLVITNRTLAPITVLLDVTLDEQRREMRAQWEKAEPGRAKKARAIRERFLAEQKATGDDDSRNDNDVFRMIPSAGTDGVSDEKSNDASDNYQQQLAATEQTLSFIKQFHALYADTIDNQLQSLYQQWSTDSKAKHDADVIESNNRESLRQQQISEEKLIAQVNELLALRKCEKEAAEKELLAATAAPPVSEKDKKNEKNGKNDKKKAPVEEEPKRMTRDQFLVRVDGVVEPLSAVQPSRQWRVQSVIENARQTQRDEVREVIKLSINRLNDVSAKSDEWSVHGDNLRAQVAALNQPPQKQLLSPSNTSRKDSTAKAAKPSKANDAKAEKERIEKEKKLMEEWQNKERTMQEAKLVCWQSLISAVKLAETLRVHHGQHTDNESIIARGKQRLTESLVNECRSLLVKVDREEKEETDRLALAQSLTITRPTSPSITTASPKQSPPPTALAVASDNAGGSSQPAIPRIDLQSLISANFPSPTPLQTMVSFLSATSRLLDTDCDSELSSTVSGRLEFFLTRWEAEVRSRARKSDASDKKGTKGKGK